MAHKSLEGSWIAQSLDMKSFYKYVFKPNNLFEYWSKTEGIDWKINSQGSYEQLGKEIYFYTDGQNRSEKLIFSFGQEGNEMVLGIRKILASEETLNGLWTMVYADSFNNASELVTQIITIDSPAINVIYVKRTSDGRTDDVEQYTGYLNVSNGYVSVSIKDADMNKINPFLITGTWDYKIVNGILVILNDVTWKSYFTKEN